jgi:hypothetical protein
MLLGLGGQERKLATLEQRYAPAIANENRLAKAKDELNRIIASGGPNMERAQKLLDALSAQAATVAVANDNAAAAQKRFADAGERAGGVIGALRGQMQNLAYQGQDVAVQLAAGTDPLLIFVQQAPHILSGFGPLGTALGLVAAGAGAAALAVGALGGQQKAAAESAKAHEASQKALDQTLASSTGGVDELAARYNSLTEEMRAFERVALAGAQRRLTEEAKAARAEVDGLVKDLEKNRALFESPARKAQLATQTLTPQQVADFERVRAVFAAIDQFRTGGSVVALTSALGQLADGGGKTAESLWKVADSLIEPAKRLHDVETRSKQVDVQMGVLTGSATATASSLLGVGTAAGTAAGELAKLRQQQAQAGASLYLTEANLKKEIEALKGGEEGLKAYNREKARGEAYTKAYNDAIRSGETALDAMAEGNRIAALAVQKFDLEQDRAAAKAGKRAEDTLTRQHAANEKLVDTLSREADARSQSERAMAVEAAARRLNAKASEEERGEVERVAGQIYDLNEARLQAARLAQAQTRAATVGMTDAQRDAALDNIRIVTEATRKFGDDVTNSAAMAAKATWIDAESTIAAADRTAREAERVAKDVSGVAETIGKDIAQNLWGQVTGEAKRTSVLDFFKNLFKRIAVEALNQRIVLPIVTQVVGAVPGLFGIQSAAGTAGAATGGGVSGVGVGVGDVFSAGRSIFGSNGYSLSSGLDAWAMRNFGWGQIGLTSAGAGLGSVAGGAANAAGVMGVPGGLVNAQAVAPGLWNGGSLTAGFGSFSNILGIGGAILPGLLAGNVGQAASGGIGAAIGTAILPGIGTALGGVLGNLFGGSLFGGRKEYPVAAGGVSFEGGRLTSSRAVTDNGGDQGAAQGIVDALSAATAALIEAGDITQKAAFNFAIESKNGSYRGYDPSGKMPDTASYGTADEVVIAGYRRALSDGIFQASSLVGKAITNSTSKELEPFLKQVDLAGRIDDGNTALSALNTTLVQVQANAKKASLEGLKPLSEDLDLAKDAGIGAEYKDLLKRQFEAIFSTQEVDFTAYETAVAQARGQAEAYKQTIRDLGLAMSESAVDAKLAADMQRLQKQAQMDINAAVNDANGHGFLNSINNIVWASADTSRDLQALGLSTQGATDLFRAQLRQILEGLDEAQLRLVTARFDGEIESLAQSLLDAADAAEAASLAADRRTGRARLAEAIAPAIAPANGTSASSTLSGLGIVGAAADALTGAYTDLRRAAAAGTLSAGFVAQVGDALDDAQRRGIITTDQYSAAIELVTQAWQDSAAAAQAAEQAAAQITQQRLALEGQILQLQGDTATLRAREKAALDPSLRALQERVYALQDEQAAEQALGRIRSENAQAAVQALQAQIQTAEQAQGAWESTADSVRKFRLGLLTSTSLSTLDPAARLAEAMRQYREALAAARTDPQASSDLTGLTQAVLEAAREVYASGSGYTAIFTELQGGLAGVETEAQRQARLQSDSLSTLRQSLATQQAMLQALQQPSTTDLAPVLAGLNSGNLGSIVEWARRQGADTLQAVLSTADARLGVAGNPYRYSAQAEDVRRINARMSDADYLTVGRQIGFTGQLPDFNAWVVARGKAAEYEAAVRQWGAARGYAAGGVVPHLPGVSTPGTDSVPAWLMPEEGVVTRRGMALLGPAGLAALNTGRLPAPVLQPANDRWGAVPLRAANDAGGNDEEGSGAVVRAIDRLSGRIEALRDDLAAHEAGAQRQRAAIAGGAEELLGAMTTELRDLPRRMNAAGGR